ncbi:MAG: hypothetical protein ACN6I7_01500 [bacterium]
MSGQALQIDGTRQRLQQLGLAGSGAPPSTSQRFWRGASSSTSRQICRSALKPPGTRGTSVPSSRSQAWAMAERWPPRQQVSQASGWSRRNARPRPLPRLPDGAAHQAMAEGERGVGALAFVGNADLAALVVIQQRHVDRPGQGAASELGGVL